MTRPLARPVVGEPAPEIAVINSAGKPWKLSDHRGHTVVVIFHRHIH